MTLHTVIDELLAVSALTGTFRLRSGTTSTRYFDKYRFEADPWLLRAIACHLIDLLPADTQVLAGLQLGGIPVATAMGLETGLPLAFVRKERKTYGTERIVEGAAIAGQQVCLIEDVVTTGGAVLDAAAAVRAEGGHVAHALCVIWRSTDAAEKMLAAYDIHLQSLCRPAQQVDTVATEEP